LEEERKGESIGGQSASSVASSTASPVGTVQFRLTYVSKEPKKPVRRRREGGGALGIGNRTEVLCRCRNAAVEVMASGGGQLLLLGSPEK
jgi:hypothetical protein